MVKAYRYYGKPAPSPKDKPYWTTGELAQYLGIDSTVVKRWCRDWFPDQQVRTGAGRGYRIPWQYLYLARLYLQVDGLNTIRAQLKPTLVSEPNNYVVMVDGKVSTHYTVEQVAEAIQHSNQLAVVIYVGEFQERK